MKRKKNASTRRDERAAPCVFLTEIPVRFDDVDHARIVYYPRWLHYFHVAFENLFEFGFGVPYPKVLDEENVGFPAVRVEVDYKAPAKYGDLVTIAVTCVRIGTKSLTLRYRATVPGAKGVPTECVAALVTVACVDMRTFRPQAIPSRHREHFARFLETRSIETV